MAARWSGSSDCGPRPGHWRDAARQRDPRRVTFRAWVEENAVRQIHGVPDEALTELVRPGSARSTAGAREPGRDLRCGQAGAVPARCAREVPAAFAPDRRRLRRRGFAAVRDVVPGLPVPVAGSACSGLAWRPVGLVMSSAQKAMSSSLPSWLGGTSLRRVRPEASVHMLMYMAARTLSSGSRCCVPDPGAREGGRAVPPRMCSGMSVLRCR
jgi:hypothetical protein